MAVNRSGSVTTLTTLKTLFLAKLLERYVAKGRLDRARETADLILFVK